MREEILEVEKPSPEVQNPERNFSLDLLKGISIILVILWHTHMIELYSGIPSLSFAIADILLNLFYINITLIAVPTFYMVSIYLLFQKESKNPGSYKKMLIRPVYVYAFWTAFQFIVYYAMYYFDHAAIAPLPSWDVLMVGGPAVFPGAYGSWFYFLFIMAVLIICAYGYFAIMNVAGERERNMVSISLILCFLVYFIMNTTKLEYWYLRNFIVYIPIAYLFHSNREKFLKFRYLFLACFILLMLWGNYTQGTMAAVNAIYGRVSVCIGAMAFFGIVCAKERKPRKTMQFLSRYSLGFYALHLYIVLILTKFFDIPKIPMMLTDNFGLQLFPFVKGLVCIVGCIILVPLLAKTPIKRMVS